MKRLRWLLIAMLGLLFCLPAGCNPPPSRVSLNDKMSRSNGRLLEKAQAFRKLCETLGTDKPAPDDTILQALTSLGETLEAVQKSFEKQQLPVRRSTNAPQLLAAYQAFLETEDEIYNQHLKKIPDILKMAAPPGAKWQMIAAEFKAAKDKEDGKLRAIHAAQSDFSEEHKFQVVPKR